MHNTLLLMYTGRICDRIVIWQGSSVSPDSWEGTPVTGDKICRIINEETEISK